MKKESNHLYQARKVPQPFKVNAGFDQLEFRLRGGGLTVGTLRERLRILKYTNEAVSSFSRRGYWYAVYNGIGTKPLMHFSTSIRGYSYLTDSGDREIGSFIVRPMEFDNSIDLFEGLRFILGDLAFQAAKLSRLDFYLDVEAELEEILRGLLVKYKKGSTEFGGGRITGINYGKRPKQITFYNKSLKEREKEPRTRIEAKLWNKAIPVNGLEGLDKFLAENIETLEHDFFKHIDINRVEYTDPKTLSPKYQEILTTIKALDKYKGHFVTKKVVSQEYDYYRDIRPLVTLIPLIKDPGVIFWQKLKPWVDGGLGPTERRALEPTKKKKMKNKNKFLNEIESEEYMGLPLFESAIERNLGGADEKA